LRYRAGDGNFSPLIQHSACDRRRTAIIRHKFDVQENSARLERKFRRAERELQEAAHRHRRAEPAVERLAALILEQERGPAAVLAKFGTTMSSPEPKRRSGHTSLRSGVIFTNRAIN
jgi:hypothetical protein